MRIRKEGRIWLGGYRTIREGMRIYGEEDGVDEDDDYGGWL